MNVSDAPTLARNLAKSCGFIRQSLSKLSKEEQSGGAGAKAERQRLTAKFARDGRTVTRTIQDTEKLAAAFDAAARILTTGIGTPSDPMARAASRLVRLNTPKDIRDALAAKLAEAASRARSALEKASDRMDAHHDDLSSVALLANLTERLPAIGFQLHHPSIVGIRRDYLNYVKSQKGSRP